MSDIEQHVDELYQLPPGAFTSARNALAKTLKGDDAARVKGLAKPTAVPWAVNQLYWHRRATYDRLITAGRALRDAQIAALTRRGGDVGHANEAHRTALADAVRDAHSLASAHGLKPSTDQLARMLEVLSLMPTSVEAPGRHTELKQSSGLEALAGISLAETADEAGARAPAPQTRELPAPASRRLLVAVPNPEAERRRAEEAAAARTRAEENVKAAARALDQARSREEAAQRDVVLAQEALEQFQLALETARRERRAANEALVAAKALT